MMGAERDDIKRLLELAADRSHLNRDAVFRTVTNILLDSDTSASERARSLASEILRKLLSEVETSLRWHLATALAERADVPHALVVALAMDKIEVAHPVLVKSPLLTDRDLIEIIHQKAEDHHLAVARRKTLSTEISAKLVETGSTAVITALLGNEGADLAAETLDFLAEESKWQHAFQEPLLHRHDLPPELAKRLYWWVAAPMRNYLCARFEIDPEIIENTLEASVRDDLAELARARHTPSKTQILVRRLRDRGKLSTDFMVNALRNGETGLFLETLTELIGLPPVVVKRLVYARRGEGLAVMCRSLGMDESNFVTVYFLTRQSEGESWIPSVSERRSVDTLYRRISAVDAQRIVRHWGRDPEYLEALRVLRSEVS